MANPLLNQIKERNVRSFCFLVRQSLSALVSTSFQHSSACRRSHSLTESVYLASRSLFGLVSSFHNRSPKLFVFYLIFIFCPYIAVYPTITSFIITQTDELVK